MLTNSLPRAALNGFKPAQARSRIAKPISSSHLCFSSTLTSSAPRMMKQEYKKYNSQDIGNMQKRTNFSYAGPRKLGDILKTELLHDKSTTEISDMWMTYHEGKEKVHGIVMDGKRGKSLLSRAAQW